MRDAVGSLLLRRSLFAYCAPSRLQDVMCGPHGLDSCSAESSLVSLLQRPVQDRSIQNIAPSPNIDSAIVHCIIPIMLAKNHDIVASQQISPLAPPLSPLASCSSSPSACSVLIAWCVGDLLPCSTHRFVVSRPIQSPRTAVLPRESPHASAACGTSAAPLVCRLFESNGFVSL